MQTVQPNPSIHSRFRNAWFAIYIFELLIIIIIGQGLAFAERGSDENSFASIVEARSNDNVVVTSGVWHVSQTTIVPKEVLLAIDEGACVSIAKGATLQILGTIKAGRYKIFSGDGNLLCTSATEFNPEWWGADPTGKNDSSMALNRSFSQSHARVVVRHGRYRVDSQLRIDRVSSLSISGRGDVVFEQGVDQNGPNGRGLIAISNSRDVSLDNLTIALTGSRSDYSGIEVRCRRVTLSNITIRNAGWHGINLAEAKFMKWQENGDYQPDDVVEIRGETNKYLVLRSDINNSGMAGNKAWDEYTQKDLKVEGCKIIGCGEYVRCGAAIAIRSAPNTSIKNCLIDTGYKETIDRFFTHGYYSTQNESGWKNIKAVVASSNNEIIGLHSKYGMIHSGYDSNNVDIKDVRVEHPIECGVKISRGANNVTLSNARISKGSYIGVFVQGSSNVQIAGSRIEGIKMVEGHGHGHGIVVGNHKGGLSPANIKIVNNQLLSNEGVAINIFAARDENVIEDNIIYYSSNNKAGSDQIVLPTIPITGQIRLERNRISAAD